MLICDFVSSTIFPHCFQLQAQLKESQSNVQALQQQIIDIEMNEQKATTEADEAIVVQAKKKLKKMKKNKEHEDSDQMMAPNLPPMTDEQIAFHQRCKEKWARNAKKMDEITREYEAMFGKQKKKGPKKPSTRKKKGSAVEKIKATQVYLETKDNGEDEGTKSSEVSSNADDGGGAEDDEVYVVESFIKCKSTHGKISFLVRWEGGDTTWEPEGNLRNDLGDEIVNEMIIEMKTVSSIES